MQLAISFGKNRWDTNWKPQYLTWLEFLDQRVRTVRRTNESTAKYDRMPSKQKMLIKDGPGFVGGFVRGGRRKRENIDSRSLFTLDTDFADQNFKFAVALMLSGKRYAIYSTHSHRPDAPRYRLIAPADREMSLDEYAAASRKLAQLIGMNYFDKTTYDAERLMYLPSCSKDATPELDVFDGEPVSVDWLLSQYADWRDPLQWPRHKDEKSVKHRSGNVRMQDPRTKRGIVGAFCRCYSISEAIAEFLSDKYEPFGGNRFTHIGSSSAGGLVVYDDYGGDTFAFSHHESDPVCNLEVNAFDLVRLHKFGHLDEDIDTETVSGTELPSYIAMQHFAETLEAVKLQIQSDATAQLQADFSQESFDDEDESEASETSQSIDVSKVKIPIGYKVINGKLFEVKETKNDIKHIPVCNALVMVSKRHVNLTDGTHGLDVTWKVGDVGRSISNTRSTFMDSKKIINLADYGLPVHSGNARALATYLSSFEAENSESIPTELVSNQMGWVKGGFLLGDRFIGGSSSISFLPKDAGDGQTAKGLHTKGSMEKTFKVLERIQAFTPVKLTIYAALAAPLLELIGESSFIFELAGGTSRGKTTALRIAASLYGCPDEQKPGFFKQWNLTKVFIERYASTMNHLPLFIDDTKNADPKMIPPTVYQFCSGQGRGRGSLKGSQIGATWCTVLLSTGEQKLASFSRDGGAVGRILSLQGSPFTSADMETAALVDEVNRIVSENYGHFAEPWIRYLMALDPNQVKAQIADTSETYREPASGHGEVAMRLARIMGILDVTGQMFDECFYTELYDGEELHQEWLKVLTGATEIDRALEALEDVMGWVTSHNKQFIRGDYLQTATVLSGRIKEDEIIVIGEQLDAFLQSKGYEPTSMAKAWKDKGWLNTEDGRTKKKVRLAGALTRAYSFNLQAVGWAYEVDQSVQRDYSEFLEADETEGVPV